MSLTKTLKDILENGETEDKYAAVCFLVDESRYEEYAQKYDLQIRKLKKVHKARLDGLGG